MATAEMTARAGFEAQLRCPRCKGRLAAAGETLLCPRCDGRYAVTGGEVPLYGLYVDDRPDEAGRDPEQVWDQGGFEKGYQAIGYHESGVEFDRQLGYPEVVSQFLFERVKGRLAEWVRPGPGHAVLDIGCGAGYFLLLIRERYRARGFTPSLSGVDISTSQLSYMTRRMAKEGVRDAIAVHANGEYLPFADESFDLVTCSEVIEHVRNPARALAEMHRVLKPDGLLLLSTPSMTAQKGWGMLLAPLAAVVKRVTRYRPTPGQGGGYDIPWYAGEFRRAIARAGFRIEAFEYNAVIPHPWHFRFVPRGLVGPAVAVFTAVDRYLKPLVRPLALHFVVRASKRAEGRGRG